MENIQKIYSDFIIQRTYARWNEDKQRRETWNEIIDRYDLFLRSKVPRELTLDYEYAIEQIRNKKLMPSMRLLWTAGKAAALDNCCAYNCSYMAVKDLDVFHEMMYLLMNGVGVGVSVERQYINDLPIVSSNLKEYANNYIVEDSKEGWALAFKHLILDWYSGIDSTYDVSQIRPKGSLIKTFGGRASGSKPLVELFEFTKQRIFNAKGRKLNSEEIADICCKTAEIVICGGVRRSAIIIFTNLSDQRMKHFKEGQFWNTNPQRALANISVAYTEKPDTNAMLEEFTSLYKSKTGERGIINIVNLPDEHLRFNPCSERSLKSRGLCNLTEVVITSDITFKEIKENIKAAVLLGTLQASLTKFNHNVLSKEWKINAEEEALLGVSLTGTANINIEDNALVYLRDLAIEYNKIIAKLIGVNTAKGITCNKPSGSVSQVVGVPSGIHPAYSEYYIRRVRVAKIDPICNFLIDNGILYQPEVGTTFENTDTIVFEFPIHNKSKKYKKDETAIKQLENYLQYKQNWCDKRGNPSVTIYVKEHEWFDVFAWINKNWDVIGGVSFLPDDNGVYQLAPYEEITEQKYKELIKVFPKTLDFNNLKYYEKQDNTEGSKTFACTSGQCDIV